MVGPQTTPACFTSFFDAKLHRQTWNRTLVVLHMSGQQVDARLDKFSHINRLGFTERLTTTDQTIVQIDLVFVARRENHFCFLGTDQREFLSKETLALRCFISSNGRLGRPNPVWFISHCRAVNKATCYDQQRCQWT